MADNSLALRTVTAARCQLAGGFLLSLALLAYSLCFLLGQGPEKYLFVVIQVLLLMNLLSGGYRKVFNSLGPLGLISLPAALILLHNFLLDPPTDSGYIHNLIGFATLVLSVVLVTQIISPVLRVRLSRVISCMAGLVVVIHFTQIMLAKLLAWRTLAIYGGLFSNPHYLANSALLTLPILLNSAFQSSISVQRRIFFGLAGLDIVLLLETGSRPAWLGFLGGFLIASFFIAKGKYKLLIPLVAVVILTFLYNTDIGILRARVDDLVATIATEERITIWGDTIKMLENNTNAAWVIGNGIGSYEHVFDDYTSIDRYRIFIFPHNFLLEITFASGLLGLALVASAYTLFFLKCLQRIRHSLDRKNQLLTGSLLAGFIMHFIHAFLTFPFYSKLTLYPEAVFFGLALTHISHQNDRPSFDLCSHKKLSSLGNSTCIPRDQKTPCENKSLRDHLTFW